MNLARNQLPPYSSISPKSQIIWTYLKYSRIFSNDRCYPDDPGILSGYFLDPPPQPGIRMLVIMTVDRSWILAPECQVPVLHGGVDQTRQTLPEHWRSQLVSFRHSLAWQCESTSDAKFIDIGYPVSQRVPGYPARNRLKKKKQSTMSKVTLLWISLRLESVGEWSCTAAWRNSRASAETSLAPVAGNQVVKTGCAPPKALNVRLVRFSPINLRSTVHDAMGCYGMLWDASEMTYYDYDILVDCYKYQSWSWTSRLRNKDFNKERRGSKINKNIIAIDNAQPAP